MKLLRRGSKKTAETPKAPTPKKGAGFLKSFRRRKLAKRGAQNQDEERVATLAAGVAGYDNANAAQADDVNDARQQHEEDAIVNHTSDDEVEERDDVEPAQGMENADDHDVDAEMEPESPKLEMEDFDDEDDAVQQDRNTRDNGDKPPAKDNNAFVHGADMLMDGTDRAQGPTGYDHGDVTVQEEEDEEEDNDLPEDGTPTDSATIMEADAAEEDKENIPNNHQTQDRYNDVIAAATRNETEFVTEHPTTPANLGSGSYFFCGCI